MTYKALAASTSPPISKATIQRILRKYNLKKWKSKQRIPLSKEEAKARFEFVRCWRQNTQLLGSPLF
jgi:histone H3/H4